MYKISDHFSCFQFHHARSSALNDRLLVLVIQVFSLEDGNLISLNFFSSQNTYESFSVDENGSIITNNPENEANFLELMKKLGDINVYLSYLCSMTRIRLYFYRG